MKYNDFKNEFSDLIDEYTYRAKQLKDIQDRFDSFANKTEDVEDLIKYKEKIKSNKILSKKYDNLINILNEI